MTVNIDRSLESLVDKLVERGYHPTIRREPKDWLCMLECGVDVLPANEPRPSGRGLSVIEALVNAMEKIR